MEVNCYCLHVNYIVYKHFDRSLHVGSLDPIFVQNIKPIPLTVFEILGFKLKNKNDNDNDKKNWRNRLFAISPMFVVQFSPNFRYSYILTLAIIQVCQKWKVKVQIGIFKCTGIMGQDLIHPCIIQSTTVLCMSVHAYEHPTF